jgi:hypothetical protein
MIKPAIAAALYLVLGASLLAASHMVTGRTQFVFDTMGQPTLSSALRLAGYFIEERWVVAALQGLWLALLLHLRVPRRVVLMLSAVLPVILEFVYVLNRPGPRVSISGLILRPDIIRYAIPLLAGIGSTLLAG